MKQILSTALAIVLFIGAAQAQTVEGKGYDRGNHKGMMKELNLTPEQQTKMQAIHKAEKQEMQALKTDGMSEADKAKRKELHEKYQAQVQAVLTPDQVTKMQSLKQKGRSTEARQDRKENRKDFAKDLNLTADQKTKMSSLNQDFKTKLQAIKNNTALTDSDRKTQMKQLAEAHKADVNALLTPEQASKMKEMRKGKGRHNRNEII